LEGGVVRGDVFVIGEGDPFLVSERLWLLANQLRLAGVRTITGSLVMDDSAGPIEDWSSFGGSDRAYAALPSALAMNFNSLAFHITPGPRSGDPVLVQQDPFALAYLEIENRLRTGPPGSPPDWRIELRPAKRAPGRAVSGPDSTSAPGTPRVTDAAYPCEIARLEGTLPAGLAPFVAYRRAREPLALAGSLLAGFLNSVGIEVGGSIATGPAPENAALLLSFDSRPVDELIGGMNRYSNNFTANQLALAAGRAYGMVDSVAPADPLRRAGAALSHWLRHRVGCSDPSLFADGSGLSTENRMTAAALVALLQFAWNDLQIHGPFLASLPGPGEDGTLERRLKGVGGVTVRAKTGTLGDAGVSTLAGYLQTPAGAPVAFAMLMKSRGERWSLSAMQDLQDRWIELYAR
jgi:D-alanyl-D-alanine carboxypeptidase/D-alanyl-D-alanine-endopeptidase (penicillin-binding protein 4)